jgi:hypothetical protein
VQLRRDTDEQLAEHPSAFLTRGQHPDRASGSGSRARCRRNQPPAGRARARPAGLDLGNGSLTWPMDRSVLCDQLRALRSTKKADHRRVGAACRVARRRISPTGHFALYGRADGPEGPTSLANGQNGLFWTPQSENVERCKPLQTARRAVIKSSLHRWRSPLRPSRQRPRPYVYA